VEFIRHCLELAQPFPWKKKGLLFQAAGENFTYGSHPCAIHLHGNEFLFAFTQRDKNSKSHIMLSHATVHNGEICLVGKPKLGLSPGDICHFDCDGTISVCFVRHKSLIYLFYVGWQNLPEGLWICDTGRVLVDPVGLTLSREFSGPILGRDKSNPLFAAATAFHVSDNLWQTWYNSGLKWERTTNGWKHFYGIHYAHSTNGVDWVCEPNMCIPFADEYEYAFGRPSVIEFNGHYYMWFAHRATIDCDTYRIGFAYSKDGRVWTRNDALAGIDVSDAGWDSEMICYPSVFEHNGILYMLYNGNGYGRTGFGWAVLEPSL
jgi:hypothetical protein